ncbi:MAG TPA: CDP-glucose 4,6-dehydratase [Verrucomicrobiae bacterium]|nr:CDP-glucose 4,6-dehydratase [Verrucomicrobiae bacterium]
MSTTSISRSFGGAFAGKRAFVTGHTGFKGSWLTEWLLRLGADVTGFSLPPATQPALFDQLGLAGRMNHLTGDIREPRALADAIAAARPHFIFHLAAQAIVRESYLHPVETCTTNVMGTINLLEAARSLREPCAVVCVTTDKCYENREWHYGYREEDALGGRDPYSASKAAAEIVIAAWRRSFFGGHPARIASARAGNVIGGGDWAADRIVPDCIRALRENRPVLVRNPGATRPWQHVLEPLSGYLWLAAGLVDSHLAKAAPGQLASAFNFGPPQESNRDVSRLVEEIFKHWPGHWEDKSDPGAPHEAGLLHLSIEKADALLGWAPVWSFEEAVQHTMSWYRAAESPVSGVVQKMTRGQIESYVTAARSHGLAWAGC